MDSVGSNLCEICCILFGNGSVLELWDPRTGGQEAEVVSNPKDPFQRRRWLISSCESCTEISSALKAKGLCLNDIYVRITHEAYAVGDSLASFLLLDGFDRMFVLCSGTSTSCGPWRLVKPSYIDFDILRGGINACKQNHNCTNRKAAEEQNILQIYAIDCSTHKIVPIDRDDPYVALSYVWGTEMPHSVDQVTEICNPNENLCLPPQLPLTIRDAITVVQKLSLRYLWVDRYCIDQESNILRRAAIDNMDQVYARAELVIVALYGDGIDFGLPGVSSVPRIACNECEVRDLYINWTLPSIRGLVRQSRWVQRAWTLQEGILAQRCLFFTEFQTYLVCGTLTRSEAFPYPEGTNVKERLEHHLTLDTLLDPYNWLGTKPIVSQRAAYTLRELTYPDDALDAFKGLLRRSGFFSLWGILTIPVGSKLNPHVGFAMGLLWTGSPSSTVNERRHGLPTWSWTSCPGEIATEYSARYRETTYSRFLNGDENITNVLEPCVRWSAYDSLQRAKVPLESLISHSKSNLLSERYKILIAEGDTVQLNLSKCRQHFILPWISVDHLRDNPRPQYFQASVDVGERPAENFDSSWYQEHGIEEHYTTEEALILVEWEDDCPAGMTRFLLMLLKWIGPNIAQRAGLLNQYSRVVPIDYVQSIPRTRRQFFLV